MQTNVIHCAEALSVLKSLPSDSIDTVITGPPYFQQREYGGGGIGNESHINDYIEKLMEVFLECVRIVKNSGTLVFNLGDKYLSGNLMLIPWRFAIEAQKHTRLINQLTWVKVNPAPKQDTRKLINSTEPFFIFAKSAGYYFNKEAFLGSIKKTGKKRTSDDLGKKYFEIIDASDLSNDQKKAARSALSEVIAEVKSGELESFRMKIKGVHALPYGGQAGGRLNQINNNGFTIIKIYGTGIRRDVIESTVETIKGNPHPAVYPEYIVQEIIHLLTQDCDVVPDPFMGSGTTAVVV